MLFSHSISHDITPKQMLPTWVKFCFFGEVIQVTIVRDYEVSSVLSAKRMVHWSENTSDSSGVAVNPHQLSFMTSGMYSGLAYFNRHGPSLQPKKLFSLDCLSRTYQPFSKTTDQNCIGHLSVEI